MTDQVSIPREIARSLLELAEGAGCAALAEVLQVAINKGNPGALSQPGIAEGKTMKFNLNDDVTITASGESGQVIGRAEYSHAEPSYLVRYKCANGRAVESWWTESALT